MADTIVYDQNGTRIVVDSKGNAWSIKGNQRNKLPRGKLREYANAVKNNPSEANRAKLGQALATRGGAGGPLTSNNSPTPPNSPNGSPSPKSLDNVLKASSASKPNFVIVGEPYGDNHGRLVGKPYSTNYPVPARGTSIVPANGVAAAEAAPNFTMNGEPYSSEPNFRTVGKPYTPTSLPAEYVGTDVTPYVNNATASAAQRGLFEKWFPRLAVAGETYGYFNPDDLEAIANGVNPDDIHLNTNKIANSMAGGGVFGAGLGALQGALAGTGAGAGALGGLTAGATAGLGLGAAGLGGYALGRAVDNATGGALSSGMSRASDWATGLDEVYDNQKKALTSSATTPEYLRQVKWLNQRNDLMKKYGISRMEANDIMEGRRQLPSTTTTSEETTGTSVDTSAPAQEATVESAATTSTTPATTTTLTPAPARRRRQAASPMETAIATPSPREQLMARRAAALEAARAQQQQAAAQYAALNAPKPGFNPSGYATGHEAYYDPYKSQLLFR